MTKINQLTCFIGGFPGLRSASATHVREFLEKEVCFVSLQSSYNRSNQRSSRDAVHYVSWDYDSGITYNGAQFNSPLALFSLVERL